MDRFEVTNLRYRRCVEAGACAPPEYSQCRYRSEATPVGVTPGHPLTRDEHPVVCINYAQAERFCRWAQGALPTEAEWERAAKGEEDRIFPWGNTWDAKRLKWGDPDGFTSPVGQFPDGASPYGVEDLGGNVWEWAERLESLAGPAEAGTQVIRGGGYAAAPIAHRVTKRAPYDATRGYPNVGFRCVYRSGS
jgi:formylglycine-generating enzyme required for sulfatase activity